MEQSDSPLQDRPAGDECAWRAVLARDRSMDGQFVTGVMSTGIYCRPSCAARHPARKNVRFFANGEQARAAGLRPCKRCLPDDVQRDERAIAGAIEAIGSAETVPRLAELAEAASYSPAHFQRIFARQVGLSPAAYARALRQQRADTALSEGDSVTDAIYAAGFGAPSRFYESRKGRTGMTASVWNKGGEGCTVDWAVIPTALGDMLLAATGSGVCRLSFDEDEHTLRRFFPKAELRKGGKAFKTLAAAVVASVEAPGDFAHIPLDVRGTAFQEAVWKALSEIPAGETRSYSQIAAAIGRPQAARPVGSACGSNSVAILIPCHRALRSDGTMGGYAYGLKMKKTLLEKEAE